MEVRQITTRKLRRRPNDPTPAPEKRRKASPNQLNFLLEDEEILEDILILNKVSGKLVPRKNLSSPAISSHNLTQQQSSFLFDARIDDGRLYYDKKWYHRNQPVFVESKDSGKVSAVISAVGTQEIWLRKTTDNGKVRVYVAQLQKGRYILRKRST